GMMLAGFSAALIGIMQFFAPSDKIKSYILWTFGSMSGLSWTQILVFALSVFAGVFISIFTFKGISGLRLGENYAHTMGINIKKPGCFILIPSAFLPVSAPALFGRLAFTELQFPLICRILFNRTEIIPLFILVIWLGIFAMLYS